jgi:hypothetical protein
MLMSAARCIVRFRAKDVRSTPELRVPLSLGTEEPNVADIDGKGVRTQQMSDRAWAGLDHETAVRMSGRRYRPGKACSRPQMGERPGGNPVDRAKEMK